MTVVESRFVLFNLKLFPTANVKNIVQLNALLNILITIVSAVVYFNAKEMLL